MVKISGSEGGSGGRRSGDDGGDDNRCRGNFNKCFFGKLTEVNNNLPTNTAAHPTANTVAAPHLTESEPESEEEDQQQQKENLK